VLESITNLECVEATRAVPSCEIYGGGEALLKDKATVRGKRGPAARGPAR
jgi:hypothetical protein